MDVFATDPKSRDVGHHVRALAFSFYTADEIRKLSVKEITSSVTFDGLGRAVPNGLYDPALGSAQQRVSCTTCGLGYQECPGHFGHIELAIPAINPLLQATVFRILRGKCWYCNRFRSNEKTASYWLTKLYYLDCGLLQDAEEVRVVEGEDEAGLQQQKEIMQIARQQWEFLTAKGGRQRVNRSLEWRVAVNEFLSAAVQGSRCLRCKMGAIKLKRDDAKIFRLPQSKTGSKQAKVVGKKFETLSGKLARVNITAGDPEEVEFDEADQTRLVTMLEIEEQLKALWKAESDACELIWGCQNRFDSSSGFKIGPEVFFIKVLAVPPSRFRPPSRDLETDNPTEHPQNVFLGRIIAINQDLLQSHESENDLRRTRLVMELQVNLNSLVDSTNAARGGRANDTTNSTGIRQQLEHKEGLFRMHMMGKRVNHSARSVIGPDPFLETKEVGVPMSFAKKLYYAEPVTDMNAQKLRKLVENGPDSYPGAIAVEDENGRVTNLQAGKPMQRNAQAKLLQRTRSKTGGQGTKRVYRHLENGDIVLFNRQPSLHRASIMAHVVRVLPKERTIRFHYANCGSYNADFDGDEMNIHLPQDEISRAEARMVVLSDRQYTTPTSGMPLRGLIQDHVVAGVLITKRDTFFTREEMQQLCFSACDSSVSENKRIVLPPPAIHKPTAVWTGKQLISLVLSLIMPHEVKFNLESRARTKPDMVGDEESEVLILHGQLLRGVLDKNQFGSSAFGLVHSFYEAYGAEGAGNLLTTLSRLFTLYLRVHAHTTGIGDLMLNEQAEEVRLQILKDARRSAGAHAVAKIVGVEGSSLSSRAEVSRKVEGIVRKRDGESQLDASMKSILSGVSSKVLGACFPGGLVKGFPENGFALMTGTGAKGSAVNSSQISCQLGQTELEGKRVPRSASGSTLPCFAPFDGSARAGGYISGRFLTGIKPPEYFFHCMAGREGLVDTAVKTARSGYLQRCLVKALEGVQLEYDMTVRDSDRAILQFTYGDDGIDPAKASWLMQQLDWQAMNGKELLRTVGSSNFDSLPDLLHGEVAKPGSAEAVPFRHYVPISEKFWNQVSNYAKRDPRGAVGSLGKKNFLNLMMHRYQRAVAEPGDAVGVLAAQGIGEPSTQMTLNTFHFAGMGAAHVTLGIPRLRELLMTASKEPKTPTMNLPILDTVGTKDVERFVQRIRRVSVMDLLEAIAVEDLGFSPDTKKGFVRGYKVRLEFPPEIVYKVGLELSFEQIRDSISKKYAMHLKSAIGRAVRKLGAGGALSSVTASKTDATSRVSDEEEKEAPEPGQTTKTNEVVPDAEEEEDVPDPIEDELVDKNEADATDARRARQKGDEEMFDDEAEEDEEAGGEENEEGSSDEDLSDTGNGDKVDEINEQCVELQVSVPAEAWGRVMIEDVAREVAAASVIRETPRISKCFVERANDGSIFVQTEGSNLQAMWEHEDWLDVHGIVTNDINMILETYGVEAARVVLIKELGMVFQAYGITVDLRHISLIADYMTVHGKYRPFNRMGMETAPSSLQKMSFETSLKFLTEAAMNAEIDQLESPSSRIAVGEIAKCGTGNFHLLHRIEA